MKRCWLIQFKWAAVALLCLHAAVNGQEAIANRRQRPMPTDIAKTLETSKNPRELATTARLLAASTEPSNHELLLRFLRSEDFLGRLDSEKEYQGPPRRLRLNRILLALCANRSITARQLLVLLTRETSFKANPARADLLIEAVAVIRPATPEVIKFWDEHCQPDDGFTPISIQAMVDNGSEPAVALLEKKLADPRFSEEEKKWWMQACILSHRYDLPLLKMSERLLAGGLPDQFRPVLVESLFDYNPDAWYGPDHYWKPPPLSDAGKEARELLIRIGSTALRSVALNERQKKAVERTIHEISKPESRKPN
jgi:hypothetical protein